METITEYQQHLMEAFDFDEVDLEVNQLGRISDRQLRGVSIQSMGWGLYALVALGIAALALVIIRQSDDFNLGKLLVLIIAEAVLVWVKHWSFVHDHAEKRCAAAEGKITLTRDRYGRRLLVIESLKLELTPDQEYMLDEGRDYRIYYAPRSKEILSVKALDD